MSAYVLVGTCYWLWFLVGRLGWWFVCIIAVPWPFDLVLAHSDLLLLLVEALLVQLSGLFLVLIASEVSGCRKGPGLVCLESQPMTSR